MLSGQIEAMIALASGLRARGHTVDVASAFSAEDLFVERRWERERGDGLSLAPKIVRIGRIVQSIAAAARQADVLHFNVPTPAFGALADAVAIFTQRPVVVGFEAHLADLPAVASRLPHAWEFYGPRVLVNNGLVARMTLRKGARYVVSSQFQRRELSALGYPDARTCVIPNLVDTSKLRSWGRAEARLALGFPEDPDAKVVAFVGHFHDVKGHDVLIEAFRAIRNQVDNAWLALAWSGIGNRARVEEAIERAGIADRVLHLGRVDVSQLFSAADVAALPYRFSIGQAAYPGTVIEAMHVGVPLVTSDLPLLAELADQGRTALLARPGDAQHLAGQVVGLLTDPERAARLVAAQALAVRERFDTAHIVEEYAALYREAILEGAGAAATAGAQIT
jgi:glycosyltransferase involved in cell wall biosynthesis